MLAEPLTPDLAARKALVAAYLYYVHDAPTISDARFDQLCNIAADGWDQLHPTRQWQLESPEATRATGMHFKFTTLCVGAARAEYARFNRRLLPPDDRVVKYDEQHGHYVTV